MSSFAVVARWVGYCQPCAVERPLVLTAHGPHGPRAWLAGYGPEDRELAYCCAVCGGREPVPTTQALDDAYDATLPRWPDLVLPGQPVRVVPVGAPVEAPVEAPLEVPVAARVETAAVVPAPRVEAVPVAADQVPALDTAAVPTSQDVWQLAVRRLVDRPAAPVDLVVVAQAGPIGTARRGGVRTSVVAVQRVGVTDLLDLLALSA